MTTHTKDFANDKPTAEAKDIDFFRECKIAFENAHARMVEQANIIASLRKSNDELTMLISAQDYRIKQLEAQHADQAAGISKSQHEIGVAEVAKFESTENDEEDDLFEKMRRRKELLSMSPVSKARETIKDFVKKRTVK
jgi:hypothetical protein